MQLSFENIETSQVFYEYVCPCGAKMTMKFMQKHGFQCPVCGRKKNAAWRRVENTTLTGRRGLK